MDFLLMNKKSHRRDAVKFFSYLEIPSKRVERALS